MPFQPNQLIGPYALERQLGRGTFGEVWLAVHRDLGEPIDTPIGAEGMKRFYDKIVTWWHDVH